MQLHSRYEGELLPVAAATREYLTVVQKGRRQHVRPVEYEVRPHASFADGLVEVRHERPDFDPLRDATMKERTKPGAIHFRYRAEVVADRDLSDCYALLSFTSHGSVGTHLIPIGRLSRGRPRAIEAELPARVEQIGRLHVFTQGLEVRTSPDQSAYSISDYYQALIGSATGLPAAELLKFERAFPHSLSADGRLLATIRVREAQKVLIVYDLESMQLRHERAVAEHDDVVRNLTWISPHEVAYVAQSYRATSGSRFMLHLLDVDTGTSRPLMEHVYGIIASLPDQPEVLVLYCSRRREGTWTLRYNVRDGKTSGLEEMGYGYTWFDRHGQGRVRVRYEGDARTYYYKPSPEARWRELDAGVKQPGLRFSLRGPQLLDRVVEPHSVGPDGDTLYVSSRLESDKFELAAYSLSQGVITQVIARHPRYDLTTSDNSISRLLFAKDSPQLIGMILDGQKPQVVWLHPGFARVQEMMDTTFPEHINWPVDWSRDGQTFIYFSSSDVDPGTYYVLRPREAKLMPLLVQAERLQTRQLARTTPFDFEARDGQMIPAYVTRPTHATEGPVPLLVYIHGGPMARDSWGYDANNQFFASRGYAVLQVNYRGSSGYGAAFQNAGLRARLDTVVIDDIADGVRHLIAEGIADPQRVVVAGSSFGGWATYLSLIKYPDLYRAGVAISAVAHWRKVLRDDRWLFDNQLAYSFWKSLLNRENFSADEKFIDAYLRNTELKQPVYIMHGEYDMIVNATEARLMLEALRKHNPHVQARSFPSAGHGYWSFSDRVIRLNEMAAFFEKHLRPAEAAAALTTR